MKQLTIATTLLMCTCLGGGQETPPPSGPTVTCGQELGWCINDCTKECREDKCQGDNNTLECRDQHHKLCVPGCRAECEDDFRCGETETETETDKE